MSTVGLSMIVRDAESELRPCLASVRGAVDQIVIADTGSTDGSLRVAAEFGATVVTFPWSGHFAEARNAALAPVTTDWVLVLDADEELAPEAAAEMAELLRGGDGCGGYQVTIRNYIRERFAMTFERMSRVNRDEVPRAAGAPAWTEHRMVRLFRRHPQIAFSGRIHEGVDASIARLGMRLGMANFRIRHFGHLAPAESRARKRASYLEMGRRKTEEQPENALGWLELGSEYFNDERWPEALACMYRCLALQPWALAALYAARIHAVQGETERALEVLAAIPDKADLGLLRHELRGDLLHDLGRLKEAREAYRTALRLSPGRQGAEPCGREGNLTSKLGYTEVRLGMIRMGLAKLARAVREMPELIDNHDRLVKAYVLLKRDSEAAEAAAGILDYFVSEKIVLRAAALCLRSGARERACAILRRGMERLPASAGMEEMLAAADGGTQPPPGTPPEAETAILS